MIATHMCMHVIENRIFENEIMTATSMYFIVSVAKISKVFIPNMGMWRSLYLLLGHVAPCSTPFKRGQGS